MKRFCRTLLFVVVFASSRSCFSAEPPPRDAQAASAEDLAGIGRSLESLIVRLDALKIPAPRDSDFVADARVFAKGIQWTLRYDSRLSAADLALLSNALVRCRARTEALEKGSHGWTERKGRVIRGFSSSIDGSVQPYAVIVPKSYDPKRASRLDVVLHGSTRPLGISELKFIARFDAGDDPGNGAKAEGDSKDAEPRDFIELHPLGRVENGYRWAGETDVYEAMEAVCRNYNIDRNRIVLRGMSMGASGTWHLGLKNPDRFVALGPYCGYVDTHHFSETPLPTFVKIGPLPPNQEAMLHLLDSLDYAANAGVVPAIACMGEKDVFFQAHELMGRAMAKEGLTMTNLISPGTGHVIDPVTHRKQMELIGAHAAAGIESLPRHLRFVTWSLKYSRCHWLQILGMGAHYQRAELEATMADDGTLDVVEPRNVSRFAIRRPVQRVRIAGVEVPLPQPLGKSKQKESIILGRRDGKWVYLGTPETVPLDGKRPGLQGPIDDAFTSPFLCVRGTGTPWNPAVASWAEASLKRFSEEWNHYFRGDLPVKNDTEVTEEDVRTRNLILFGDPGSNAWIARLLPHLPLEWTRERCTLGGAPVTASDHAPILIQPSPFASNRYVVLNSGHTFRERELSTLNYLLFPRIGDWAILKVGTGPEPQPDKVVRDGFFDERWSTSAAETSTSLQSFFQAPARFADDLGRLPSPLIFEDGTTVRSSEDWKRRRQEIRATWNQALGAWPPVIEKPRVDYLNSERRGTVTQRQVRLEIAPGWTSDEAYLLIPDGAGPFPAMVVVYYEAKTGIGRGKTELRDFAIQLASRGFVTLSYGSDPSTYYPDKTKPQLQPLSFHAYVAANLFNVLAGLPQVDAHRIGVMGHSYGGKWALFASCLDDRFACGVWSDPGVVFDETRPSVNYWEPWYLGWEPGPLRKRGVITPENPRTGPYRRLVEKGHDLQELHALMAPRPFLVSGGAEDQPDRWRDLNHAVAVNRLLGFEHRVAMTNRAGHPPTVESNEQIYRFLEVMMKQADGRAQRSRDLPR